MAMKLKLIPIGDSTGVILPKELMAELGIREGDELDALATPDGVRLTLSGNELNEQMKVAEDVMRRRRDLLRKLAE